MKNNPLKLTLPQLFPSRVPRLYFGATPPTRPLTPREKLAERLFVGLQIFSYSLFAVGGIVGYVFYQLYGLILLTLLGYLAGVWVRRSLGIRGLKPTTGFFMRLRERARGAPPGLLEWLLEKLSQNELPPAKCQAILQVYDRSVTRLKKISSTEDQNAILAELDRRVKNLYYD